MTIDQIISLSTSVGACLAAIATFLTVWQIAKQRKASYRPELVLGSAEFEATSDVNFSGFPRKWRHPDPPTVPGVTLQLKPNVFEIPLANIGLAAARNVSISWTFAIDEAVKKVNKLASQAGLKNFITFERGVLKMESPMLASFWINQKTGTMDYVLPASVAGGAVPLSLPDAYVTLVSAAASLHSYSGIQEIEERHELLEPPMLSVELKFDDIGGARHTASFDLGVSIRGVNIGKFFGYVETRRRR